MKFNFSTEEEEQEALKYRPGQRVELISHPGVVDIIAEYDPMMVPPIWLANDPRPRYPHELNLLPMPVLGTSWFSSKRGLNSPLRRQSSVSVASNYHKTANIHN